ncbi:MAG: SRPBCC family protein [Conexibacter sp.]
MRLQHVHVQQDFAQPVERVYAYLSEHENLGVIFKPLRVVRVRDGQTERNGVGSTRRLSFFGLMPFDETVTAVLPNERIVYTITKGGPMKDHEGVMAFSARPDGGSHLDYRIRFASAVPGLAAIVKRAVTRSITAGLKKVDRAA